MVPEVEPRLESRRGPWISWDLRLPDWIVTAVDFLSRVPLASHKDLVDKPWESTITHDNEQVPGFGKNIDPT